MTASLRLHLCVGVVGVQGFSQNNLVCVNFIHVCFFVGGLLAVADEHTTQVQEALQAPTQAWYQQDTAC